MSSPNLREVLAEGEVGATVTVQGWLRSARHSKGLSFLDLTDGSSMAGLQVVAPPELVNYESEVRSLGTGAAVRVTGELVESPGKGQRVELRAGELEVVGVAPDDYPLQKKRHSFEYLRTIAHLRPRTNTIGAVFRVRNVAAKAIHRFFQEEGFVWLHTPILTGADAEGAGEMFEIEGGEEFFGRPTRLTVSGQLEAEIGALSMSKVYTFGPTFRAENSNTSRHLAEFWMVEPEMAFCDLEGDRDLAERFLRAVFRQILDECGDDLAFFDERIEKGVVATLEHIAETPFEHMTYSEAVAQLEKSGRDFEFPVQWGADLQSEHERWLTEERVKKPLVVTDYPAAIKAFYMYANDDAKTVRAMDVLVPRIGEIIGGSQREHRHDVLAERMDAQGLDREEYAWYLELRRFGSVPHAGFGLGFERLVQFATGMANIRDVVPFPRVPGYAEF
ncbi:MAG: asparagine--tRNA ligase [Deltaproteobacteria bacterium]|jgi:asparaginyl-tRNA synthetase|nr:asparagine--tRNA ligase [Deltaproteobacteria bacterium]